MAAKLSRSSSRGSATLDPPARSAGQRRVQSRSSGQPTAVKGRRQQECAMCNTGRAGRQGRQAGQAGYKASYWQAGVLWQRMPACLPACLHVALTAGIQLVLQLHGIQPGGPGG